MLHILIPAAGKSSRFSDAGYITPKPFLSVGSSLMLEAVAAQAQGLGRVLAAVPWEFAHRAVRHVSGLVPMFRATRGQAETVQSMLNLIPRDSEVLVINSDQTTTYPLRGFVEECQEKAASAGVLTFESENPAYSYVKGWPWVMEAAEKVRISAEAVAGFYYFKNAGTLQRSIALHAASIGTATGTEVYLSPVLNLYKSEALNVRLSPLHSITSWGTPEEYQKHIATLS